MNMYIKYGNFVQTCVNFFHHLNWLLHSISYFLRENISFLHKLCDFAQNLSSAVYDLLFYLF